MFKSIVRPLRVSRFSKTVSFPQSNSSLIPGNRQGFNFDKPRVGRCFVQPLTSHRSRTALIVIRETEQTYRSPRTDELIASSRARANSNPAAETAISNPTRAAFDCGTKTCSTCVSFIEDGAFRRAADRENTPPHTWNIKRESLGAA